MEIKFEKNEVREIIKAHVVGIFKVDADKMEIAVNEKYGEIIVDITEKEPEKEPEKEGAE